MILISDITSRLGTYLCCTQYISQCRAYCIIMLKSSKDPNGQLKCKSVQKSPPHDFVTNNSELRWLSKQDAPTEHHPLSFDPCWKKKVGCLWRGCKIHESYIFHLISILCHQMSKLSNLVVIRYCE